MINRPSTAGRRKLLADKARLCKSPIVFYGDSLIHYWEKEGKEAWDKYLAPLDISAFGIEGDTTSDLKQRLLNGELELARDPSSCMVLIGTNNTTLNWGKEPLEDTLFGIMEIISILLTRFPLARIYVQKLFPRGRAVKNAVLAKCEKINEVMDTWKTPRVEILSHGDLLLLEDGKIDPLLTTDYIHLSPAGYEKWALALASLFSSPVK